MNTINQIETERLILRPFVESDYQAVYDFASDDEVQKYTGQKSITSVEEAKAIIKNSFYKDYATYGYGRWAVIYKPDNRLIGFNGLKFMPEVNDTDIGYRYLKEYWGKGIATEAAKPMIKYGFEHLNLEKIIGIAMHENVASCKVLEKLGLVYYKKDYFLDSDRTFNWYQIKKADYKS